MEDRSTPTVPLVDLRHRAEQLLKLSVYERDDPWQLVEDLLDALRVQAQETHDIVDLLQRVLQPDGSPPPGGRLQLAQWIIRAADASLQLLRQEKEEEAMRADAAIAAGTEMNATLIALRASLARLQAYAQCLPTCESWQRHAEPAHDDVKATAKRCTCGLAVLTQHEPRKNSRS